MGMEIGIEDIQQEDNKKFSVTSNILHGNILPTVEEKIKSAKNSTSQFVNSNINLINQKVENLKTNAKDVSTNIVKKTQNLLEKGQDLVNQVLPDSSIIPDINTPFPLENMDTNQETSNYLKNTDLDQYINGSLITPQKQETTYDETYYNIEGEQTHTYYPSTPIEQPDNIYTTYYGDNNIENTNLLNSNHFTKVSQTQYVQENNHQYIDSDITQHPLQENETTINGHTVQIIKIEDEEDGHFCPDIISKLFKKLFG